MNQSSKEVIFSSGDRRRRRGLLPLMASGDKEDSGPLDGPPSGFKRSSTIKRPVIIGFPFSLATRCSTAKASSVFPLAARYRALSGSHEQTKTKAIAGSVDKPSNHLQPRVGITVRARRTSKHAPNAQKLSSRTTHLPRCFTGKNSAYNVTLDNGLNKIYIEQNCRCDLENKDF